jgi:type I restriction enzyme S subunit
VRGKLVPQDSNEDPASELRKQIAKNTERLLKAGQFREPGSFVRIDRDALPFTPPSHWAWARLVEIARPSYGFAFTSSRFNTLKRGMPLIRIRDISSTDTEAYFDGDYDPTYLVTAGDYLVGMDGDFNLRRWHGVDGLLNQRVMRINDWRCGIDPEFVRLPLQFVLDHLHGETSLTTVKHLSAKQVNGIEIPLPPLGEQRRIVAKVDELMTLCDRLEAARGRRESARDRLAAVGLARLNAADPETFEAEASFVVDALPALTTRPDQIKQLRKTILNLAVRGRLVPQGPDDQSVAELLKRIEKEKIRLLEERGIKPDRPLPGVASDEIPFSVPEGWVWARTQDLSLKISDGVHQKPNYVAAGIPFVTVKNLTEGAGISFRETKFIT